MSAKIVNMHWYFNFAHTVLNNFLLVVIKCIKIKKGCNKQPFNLLIKLYVDYRPTFKVNHMYFISSLSPTWSVA